MTALNSRDDLAATLSVRPLEAGDTALLYAHFSELSEHSRAKFRPHPFDYETAARFTGEGLTDPECIRFIALVEYEGAPHAAGYCFIADLNNEVPWVGIAVGDRWQGMGAGRRMMECMIAHAKALGKRGLRLTTDKDNIAGQTLYQKCGFVITGEGDEDDYRMKLEF